MIYATGVGSSGDSMAVQVLLAYGANPNRAALYGVTPLMLATAGGHTEVAAALLKAGAARTRVTCTG